MVAWPAEGIPGDPDVLREAANALERSERRAAGVSECVHSARRLALAGWSGLAAQGFEGYSAEALRCAVDLAGVGPAAAKPLRIYADRLETAQRRYASAVADAHDAERAGERAEDSRAEHKAREDGQDAQGAMGSARDQALAANEDAAREIRALRESLPKAPSVTGGGASRAELIAGGHVLPAGRLTPAEAERFLDAYEREHGVLLSAGDRLMLVGKLVQGERPLELAELERLYAEPGWTRAADEVLDNLINIEISMGPAGAPPYLLTAPLRALTRLGRGTGASSAVARRVLDPPPAVPNLTVRKPNGQVAFRTDSNGRIIAPGEQTLTFTKGDYRAAMRQDQEFLGRVRDAQGVGSGEIQSKRRGATEAGRRAFQHLEDLGGG